MNKYKIFYIILIIFLYYLFNYFYRILYKLKVCLCVIGKNENLYIKEFVNYYINLGYNHIYLYDNNDINEERFEDVIKDEINSGFISIINYRGYRGDNINPQIEAYKDCYEKNSNKYDWLSFFDIDEYLELIPSYFKIQNFLGDKRFSQCQNIKLNWVYYMSNHSLYYKDKPLQERVNISFFNISVNRHIKSTVRGHLSSNYWLNAITPHSSSNKFNCCSSSGKYADYKAYYIDPPDFKYAYLKHFQGKSFEEFCLKIKRGRPIKKYKKYREEAINKLIKENKNNKEKMYILKKIFNITID